MFSSSSSSSFHGSPPGDKRYHGLFIVEETKDIVILLRFGTLPDKPDIRKVRAGIEPARAKVKD